MTKAELVEKVANKINLTKKEAEDIAKLLIANGVKN